MAEKRQVVISVFLDSSVLFAAVLSPTGGSAKLFTLSKVSLVVSSLVLAEVERNLRDEDGSFYLDRLFMLADKLKIVETQIDDVVVLKAMKVIVDKDARILADAKRSKVNILVSLDKKHFHTDQVRKFIKPGRILTPGELISST